VFLSQYCNSFGNSPPKYIAKEIGRILQSDYIDISSDSPKLTYKLLNLLYEFCNPALRLQQLIQSLKNFSIKIQKLEQPPVIEPG
jgi:hypothetical protein